MADDLVLDLSQITFIDSTGLYGIVAAVRNAQAQGLTLRISSSLGPQVSRLFKLVGMSDTLPLVDD
jgi:anti-anti-sigma factor